MRLFKIDRLAMYIILLVSCVSVLILTGYVFGVKTLTNMGTGLTAMNPITAVCFLLCSAWFLAYLNMPLAKKTGKMLSPLGVIGLLAGIGKLLEYAGLSTIHFDRWFFFATLSKVEGLNAMAPNTALLFLFTGLLMINAHSTTAAGRTINDVIKLPGFIIAYFSIVGYIYNIKTAYRIGLFVPMALNTAICFIAVFLAGFLSFPQGSFTRVIGSPLVGGRLARKAIPLLLLIPPAFGYLPLLGERAGLNDVSYSTALNTAFIAFLLLIFLYLYAKQLNKQDEAEKGTLAEKLANEKKIPYAV